MSDVQRLFLQSILSRGVITEKVARILWVRAHEAVYADRDDVADLDTSNTSWSTFVGSVNTSLNDLDFEFRRYMDGATGSTLYCLTNAKGDEISQLATDFTVSEITYFKAVIEQMVLAPRFSFTVSSMAALRETSAIKPKINISKIQAEAVLASFVARGWLSSSRHGRYTLASRTIIELGPYLKTTYPDYMLQCIKCRELVTRGAACHGEDCNAAIHLHCFKVVRQRSDTCPNESCNAKWPKEAEMRPMLPIGEAAFRNGDDSRRRVREDRDEEDEDEDPNGNSQRSRGTEDQSDETEDVPQKAKGRRGARKLKAREKYASDMSEDEVQVPPETKRKAGKARHSSDESE